MEKNKRLGLIAGFLLLSLISGAITLAAEKNPCSEDVAKLCKDVAPEKKAIMGCLAEHEKELSASCKDYRAKLEGGRIEIREEMRERVRFHRSCKDDIAKFCKEIIRDMDGVIKCLGEHENELSASCSEMIKAARKEDGKKKTE